MAPQVRTHPGTRPTNLRRTVDTKNSTATAPHPSTEGLCACYEGLVFIGHLVEADGEEVEVIDAVPCRRCTDSR